MSQSQQYRPTGLREVLRLQGRKARWLAAKVGVHEALLSHAMSGRRTLDAETATRVADALGVPFFALFESATAEQKVTVENIAMAVAS